MNDDEINEELRGFKGIWIPKEIWTNKKLSLFEKCLFAEIDSLDDKVNGCTASNEYFSKFFSVTSDRISTYITKLKRLGLIEQIKFNGRVRTLKSNLSKLDSLTSSIQTTRSRVVSLPDFDPTINNIVYNKDNNRRNIGQSPSVSSILSKNQIEILEKYILFWNDYLLKNLKDNKIKPQKVIVNKDNPSKSLINLIKILNSLEKGTFLKQYNVKEQYNLPIDYIFTTEEIKKTIENYFSLFEEKTLPNNWLGVFSISKMITNFSSFIFNHNTQKSFFLYVLKNGVKPIDNKFEIPNEIKERYYFILNNESYIEKNKEKVNRSIYANIRGFTRIVENLSKLYNEISIDFLVSKHIEYISSVNEWQKDKNYGNILFTNHRDLFSIWIKEKFNIDLYPDEEKINYCIKQAEMEKYNRSYNEYIGNIYIGDIKKEELESIVIREYKNKNISFLDIIMLNYDQKIQLLLFLIKKFPKNILLELYKTTILTDEDIHNLSQKYADDEYIILDDNNDILSSFQDVKVYQSRDVFFENGITRENILKIF